MVGDGTDLFDRKASGFGDRLDAQAALAQESLGARQAQGGGGDRAQGDGDRAVFPEGGAGANHRDGDRVALAVLVEAARLGAPEAEARDHLVRRDGRLADAHEELAQGQGPGAAHAHQVDRRVQGEQGDRNVASGAGGADVAAHGPPVADLRAAHLAGRIGEHRDGPSFEGAMGAEGADVAHVVFEAGLGQIVQMAQVDHALEREASLLHLDHHVGPARQEARAKAQFRLDFERLLNRLWLVEHAPLLVKQHHIGGGHEATDRMPTPHRS
ncbi:hypothetical protein D3C86_1523560 [compost metagenome]